MRGMQKGIEGERDGMREKKKRKRGKKSGGGRGRSERLIRSRKKRVGLGGKSQKR